ncbi:MAG: helix-turn-helix transcriptional regulator [Syntrophomonadaceae bacterium]|nr:helix-turn-helix transcriptional regulator [Syntrophomonadaceae bacterium]
MADDWDYIDRKLIGQRIREGREIFGLSREGFAEMLALSDYYIGQLERGQRQMSLGVLVKIASRLHISLDYLVLGKTKPDNDLIADAGEDTYAVGEEYKTRDLANLISMCSSQELDLIEKLIKTILPYIR